jgi:hypothetical protein
VGKGQEEAAISPVGVGFDDGSHQYPRAPAIKFAGLAASLARGKEGNWRGGVGLL